MVLSLVENSHIWHDKIYKMSTSAISFLHSANILNDSCWWGERMESRSERGKKKERKKMMEVMERMKVLTQHEFIKKKKWLCLSIQLKWIKECNDWQSLLHWPYNFLNRICCSFYAPSPLLLSFFFYAPFLLPFWSPPLPSPLFIFVSQLICYSIKGIVLLLCITSALPTRLTSTSALPSIPLFHVKKIRSADWFVFVSRCSVAATAIGNP